MSPINTPPEGKGQVNLVARCFIMGEYRECFVIDANAKTQMARVMIVGTLVNASVCFSSIQNVAYKYDSGEILQSFGAPKTANPDSIAYIQFSEVQS